MKTRRQIHAKLTDTQKSIEKWTQEYKSGNITENDYKQIIDLFTIREDILEWVLARRSHNE